MAKKNTLLYVGLGAAALFLFMRSKGMKLPFASSGESDIDESETPQKRGRVEVGPTETLSEQEYYGQAAQSPISRIRQQVQSTAEDIQNIRETAEGLLPGGAGEGGGGGFTSPADFAVKKAIENAKRAKRKAQRAARIAARKAKAAARRAKRKLKRGLRKGRRLRRGKRLGEMDFI